MRTRRTVGKKNIDVFGRGKVKRRKLLLGEETETLVGQELVTWAKPALDLVH